MEGVEEELPVEEEDHLVDDENVVGRAELKEILELAFRKGVADGKRREMKRLFNTYGFEAPKSKTKLRDLRTLFDDQMGYASGGNSRSRGLQSSAKSGEHKSRTGHPSMIMGTENDSEEHMGLPYPHGTYDSMDRPRGNSPTPLSWNVPRGYHSDGMNSQGSGQESRKYEERRTAHNGEPYSSRNKAGLLMNPLQLSVGGYNREGLKGARGRHPNPGYEDDYEGKDFEFTKHFGRKEGSHYNSGSAVASGGGRAEGVENLASGFHAKRHYDKKNDKSYFSVGVNFRVHLSPPDGRFFGGRKGKKIKSEVDEEEEVESEEKSGRNPQAKFLGWALKKVLSRYGLGGGK